jgi:vacuolar-type H+-ATPase subunit C/Vma6
MVAQWRLAYSYSKTSGILAHSFLGPRLGRLSECQSARELYAMVFGGTVPELTEPELILAAGKAVSERILAAYRGVERIYGARIPLLAQAMRGVEFNNVKTILRALDRKAPVPALRDSGAFSEIKAAAYPELPGLFGGTRFEWLVRESADAELWKLDNRLDRQFYRELLDSAALLPKADRIKALRLLCAEARLRNAVWAIRLSVYYRLGVDDIRPLLIEYPGHDLAKEALAAAAFSPEDKPAWLAWKFSRLVNVESRGPAWSVDPRAIEHAARREIYKLIRRNYHSGPFSRIPAYAFLRLKQFEGDFIRSCFEGIRLSMGSGEIAAFIGAQL